MDRISALRTALLQNHSSVEAESFFNYELTKADITFLQDAAKDVLRNMEPKAFNCAQMSAIWAAIIQDNSTIPVAVVCGDLQFLGRNIFICKEPLPAPEQGSVVNGVWDGHCWLEFGGVIADLSFFRTVYYGDVPREFRNLVIAKFGEGRGSMIATPEQMEINGFKYKPIYTLSNLQINGLINGIPDDSKK